MNSFAKFRFAKIVGTIAIAFIVMGAAVGLAAHTAQAANWEIYDKGEHVFLPEGPIEQDGVIMVPLRPIAERFGYQVSLATKDKVLAQGGVVGKVLFTAGSTTVRINDAADKQMEKAAVFINGNLFITMEMAGYLTDIGYSVVPGTSFIQLRPIEGDALAHIQKQYWHVLNNKKNTQFMNNQGEVLLNSEYSGHVDFGYDELTPVMDSYQYVGYMDRSGKLAIRAPYYRLDSFSEGLASFKELQKSGNGYQVKYGYLNRTGKVAIPAKYDHGYNFSDGLAKVVLNGKTFYIDHNGKTAIAPIPNSASTDPFHEGLAAVAVFTQSNGKFEQKTGFIDTTGKFVIPPIFDYAGYFSDGMAMAVAENGKKNGYIDRTGKWMITMQDADLYPFQNGFAQYYDRKSKTTGLIDKKGKKLLFPNASNLSNFAEGLIRFQRNSLYGYMDVNGKTMIEPQFKYASTFEGGIAQVELQSPDPNHSIHACINKTGEVIWRDDAK